MVKVFEDGITDAQTCRSNILTYLLHGAEFFLRS